MDTYDYMTTRDTFKYAALYSDDDAPPRHRTHRQRDVDPKRGQPLADIARTMGHAECSRSTGESYEEYRLRQQETPHHDAYSTP